MVDDDMNKDKLFEWDIVGKSVRGSFHKKSNIPNQDSITVKKSEAWSIVSISDGHGSKKNFRSNVGAQIATLLFAQELNAFMEMIREEESLSSIKERLEEKLAPMLIRKWKRDVNRHFRENPFNSSRELDALSKKEIKLIEKNPEIAYGATLLGVLVCEGFISYIQLGDGDINAIYRSGEVSKPIPRDKRFIANETSSLCTERAWNEINLRFQVIVDSPPDLILVCTDGYTNSFDTEDDFFSAGRDFLSIVDEYGIDYIEENLEDWLSDNSAKGSGDDVTVAIISKKSNKE